LLQPHTNPITPHDMPFRRVYIDLRKSGKCDPR
jgi:hypothetical protein